MGLSMPTNRCLLALAGTRLKKGGRLVFWLPTPGNLTDVEVRGLLQDVEREEDGLVFQNTMEEKLHDELSRWLCIYHKET
jgi:tRNA G10  N-methylase Trm11